MATCTSKIASNLDLDCANLPVAGVDATLYLANKADVTFTEASDIITTLTMAASTFVYRISMPDGALTGRHNLVSGGLIPGYSHEVEFILPLNTQAAKEEAMNLAKGRVVAVLLRNNQSGEGYYEIYGRAVGLSVAEHTGDTSDGDTNGNIRIILRTADGQKEPEVPIEYTSTDTPTTTTQLTGLVAA